jgi:hypothetical protein
MDGLLKRSRIGSGQFGPNHPQLGLATDCPGQFKTVQKKLSGLFSRQFFAISGRFQNFL